MRTYSSGINLEYHSYNLTLLYLSVVREIKSLHHCFQWNYVSNSTCFARDIAEIITWLLDRNSRAASYLYFPVCQKAAGMKRT